MLSLEKLEMTVDRIRYWFGHNAMLRASSLLDRKLNGFSPKEDHTSVFILSVGSCVYLQCVLYVVSSWYLLAI